nr:glycosyltransferase family 2 protein [Eoetvoesiella caeni]
MVSVIIPSYNAERLISETLESVLKQSYKNWEAIVIDDCSRDATQQVVKTYAEKDARIRLIALDKNNGAPAAPRNIGVREARGQWIALLDADDIWHPRKLELQLKAMAEIKIQFSCTQMQDFSDGERLAFEEPQELVYEVIDFQKQQLKGRIPASSVILSRELLLSFPFNEETRYKAVEDYHCWLRILQTAGSAVKLNYPLLRYRKSDEQISRSKMKMLGRVYMVHKEYPRGSVAKAMVFTATHAIGAFYYRILKRKL